MFSFGKELRAPAYKLILGLLRWINCSHSETTHPINGYQHCLGCGCTRQYRFDDAGIFIGRWRKPLPPAPTAQPVWDFATQANKVVQRPVDIAALRARNTRTFPATCKDCGTALDHFGACPAASPLDKSTKRSPVFCQRTEFGRVETAAHRLMDRHLGKVAS